MAYSDVIFSALDYTTQGDLSGNQYNFVKRGTGQTIAVAAAGDAAVGVLWNAPAASGRAATVVTGGRPHVYAGATIADGAEVMSNATGKAVTATATNTVLGYALHGAASGELVQIEILPAAQFTK